MEFSDSKTRFEVDVLKELPNGAIVNSEKVEAYIFLLAIGMFGFLLVLIKR